MKTRFTHLATVLLCGVLAAAHAAVPVVWTNTPAATQPYPIKPVPHGVPVDFRVTLRGYTDPPAVPGADVRLWFQTNGMGSAWWSAPATLDGDTITATFGAEQDTGADRVSLFFGAPSNVFASAVLRLTHSPGFTPAALPLPVQSIDFSAVEILNAPWATPGLVSSATNDLSSRVAAEYAPLSALRGYVARADEDWTTALEKLGLINYYEFAHGSFWRFDALASEADLAYRAAGLWDSDISSMYAVYFDYSTSRWREEGRGPIAFLYEVAAATNALAARIPSTDPAASANVVRYCGGKLTVSVARGATLTASTSGWRDGAAVFARLVPAGPYAVSGITLVGYGLWPTNSAQCVFWNCDGSVFCNVIKED